MGNEFGARHIDPVGQYRMDFLLAVHRVARAHQEINGIEFGGFPFERLNPTGFEQMSRSTRRIAAHAERNRSENQTVRVVFENAVAEYFGAGLENRHAAFVVVGHIELFGFDLEVGASLHGSRFIGNHRFGFQ